MPENSGLLSYGKSAANVARWLTENVEPLSLHPRGIHLLALAITRDGNRFYNDSHDSLLGTLNSLVWLRVLGFVMSIVRFVLANVHESALSHCRKVV